jgi:2,3-dihydroxy-p-cumate/2,3-dihydroxybenzoate 3,4-dioxygenase
LNQSLDERTDVMRLQDICYVRLGTPNLDAADRFVRDVLGLEKVRQSPGIRHYRSDERDHTLVYFEGDRDDHTVGFAMRDSDALETATAVLGGAGIAVRRGSGDECEERRVQALVGFRAPGGHRIELVVAPSGRGRRFRPSFDAGIRGFSHVGLCTTDAQSDERFWVDVLGARVSDRIGPAALLRIDETHHKVALFPAARPGVQHINHQLAGIDDVMRSWYRLRRQKVPIVFGPGRHPTSGAVFLYFRGPDDMVFEYSTGVRLITVAQERAYRPRQFPFEPESFCMWGAVPEVAEFDSSLT